MQAQIDGKYSLLPVGTLLHHGAYRVVRHLASGGFGNTYEALDKNLDRTVAIKEFFPKMLCGRSCEGGAVTLLSTEHSELFTRLRTKFKKEAVRISALNHPYIVRVLTYFEEQGTAFYVMDYLEGESLSARMKHTGRPLSENEVQRYLPQVLGALKEMHAQQLWHLDLKPGNIMINGRDEAVLIDFGASKQLHSEDGHTLTTSLNCAYTPGYAPMELVDQSLEDFGPWTDLYSLGATLYTLFTLQSPPTYLRILKGEPLHLPDHVSAPMQQLITWLMQPMMGKRPQSVVEVEAWLRKTSGTVVDTPQDNAARVPQPETVCPESVSTVCVDTPEQVMGQTDAEATMRRTGYAEADLQSGLHPSLPTVIRRLVENMVYVEGGTFTMGASAEQGDDFCDDEKPTHQVTLSSFYIGKYEVTQAEWETVMGSNPSQFKGANLPVERVSWNDCQEFIRKLNEMTGKNFRLPTEAEWEFAARGGNKSIGFIYAGGNDLRNVGWYHGNSRRDKENSFFSFFSAPRTTHEVGQKRSNELGLYDMSGNVCEWCQDWYGGYSSTSQTNPQGPGSGNCRVLRGGSWDYFARYCRLSYRRSGVPDYRFSIRGLRLALPNLQ